MRLPRSELGVRGALPHRAPRYDVRRGSRMRLPRSELGVRGALPHRAPRYDVRKREAEERRKAAQ